MKLINLSKILLITLISSQSSLAINKSSNPFAILGIPNLNPSQMFKVDNTPYNNYSSNQIKGANNLSSNTKTTHLTSLDDLPKFLQRAKLTQVEGIKLISKFLIADDYMLKKSGAIFDQSGFDGLMPMEEVAPIGNKDRSIQRARSAAKIYDVNNFKDNGYEAYGAEKLDMGLIHVPNGWEVYRVLLVGKGGVNDHIFFKVCLPLDEILVPLVVKMNDDCLSNVRKRLISLD